MEKVYKLTILWGTDGFGKWLCEYILKHFRDFVEITLTGSDVQKWKILSERLGVEFSNNNRESVKNGDIIIYCVPIAHTQSVIEETLPHIQAWSIVADVTSIKKFPSREMQKRKDLLVIPTHPMFGPYISSIAGQVVVLTPEESVKKKKEYIFLKKYLENHKARVMEVSPKYHDKMMAVVQGLTHLNMFVVGETMKRIKFNIADSMNFISPIYKLMISSVGRYLWQNPWLYADIQMYNDEVWEVYEAFLETAYNFHTSVKNKDAQKFCQDIIEARDFLWVKNCQEWQEYTDKVIYMLGEQVQLIKNNIWKHIALKNIYSREVVEWKLEKYKSGKIFLSNGKNYTMDTHEILVSWK